MAEFDLDADRAARAAEAEATGESHVLRAAGQAFRLPPELPLGFTSACAKARTEDDARDAFTILLGKEQGDRFFRECQVTEPDLVAIIAGLEAVYGVPPGEAPASNGSSANGSSRSRPTSSGSTRSTSGKPAGAKKAKR